MEKRPYPESQIHQLKPGLWLINDNEVYMYLIEGKEKALLIDTGWGIRNLRQIIAGLTALPLLVVNTHGHPDHVSGNYQFERLFIHHWDALMMREKFTRETRCRKINRFSGMALPLDFDETRWVEAKAPEVTLLQGAEHFDLGGRVIEVIETPGHSPGSICFLDQQEKLLFTGDTVIENIILLHLPESQSLETFQKSISKLRSCTKQVEFIFPSHGKIFLEPCILMDLENLIGEIISGKTIGRSREIFSLPGLFCKKGNVGLIYKAKI